MLSWALRPCNRRVPGSTRSRARPAAAAAAIARPAAAGTLYRSPTPLAAWPIQITMVNKRTVSHTMMAWDSTALQAAQSAPRNRRPLHFVWGAPLIGRPAMSRAARRVAVAEHSSRSKRSAALNSQNQTLAFAHAMKQRPLPTGLKGRRQTRRVDACSSI